MGHFLAESVVSAGFYWPWYARRIGSSGVGKRNEVLRGGNLGLDRVVAGDMERKRRHREGRKSRSFQRLKVEADSSITSRVPAGLCAGRGAGVGR